MGTKNKRPEPRGPRSGGCGVGASNSSGERQRGGNRLRLRWEGWEGRGPCC